MGATAPKPAPADPGIKKRQHMADTTIGTKDQWGGLVRAVLTAVGTILAGNGWVTDGTWQMVSGVVLALFAAGWSWYTNRPSKIVDSKTALPKDPVGANKTADAIAAK